MEVQSVMRDMGMFSVEVQSVMRDVSLLSRLSFLFVKNIVLAPS